ncbi:MAG: hypothetical protein IJT16_04720 [Lachnospiraceae bacterium]|nr:hypothetical protein [Lachnospiraceae bacterium]
MAEEKKPVTAAAPKKAAPKKVEPVKKETAAKKPAAKRGAAKKTVAKESIVIQHNGVDFAEKDLFKAAKAAYKKAGNKDEVKEVTIYVNTEEGKYYPVVNGTPVDGIDL